MPGESHATSSLPAGASSPPASSTSPTQATAAPAPSTEPRRRFVPEAIETTTKSRRSSRPEGPDSAERTSDAKEDVVGQQQPSSTDVEMTSPSPPPAPRRFAPEPVETTTKTARKPLPQPDETTTKSARRALPQPEETSSKSTKRRFVPQPIESSSRSRRNSGDQQTAVQPSPRRFVPEPIEFVKSSNRKPFSPRSSAPTSRKQTQVSAPRKFNPDLIETASRSKKSDAPPELTVYDRTEPSAAYFATRKRRPIPPGNTPAGSLEAVPRVHESRFSAANILARQEKREVARRDSGHSFHVPELPSIASSNSGRSSQSEDDEESDSSTTSSQLSLAYKQKARQRESCDERFSGYLLALAARAAEKQLREQALAAFPNEGHYQHIDHFAVDNEEGSDGDDSLSPDFEKEFERIRRESAADLGREFAEMRKFKELAETRRENNKDFEEAIDDTPAKEPESRFSASALAAKYRAVAMDASDMDANSPLAKWQKEKELKQMSKAASPPMLGSDIKFPFSLSPEGTRCETDQAPRPHHDSQGRSIESASVGGLWHADSNNDDAAGEGLWHGVCKKGSQQTNSSPVLSRAMLMTPAVEMEDPFSKMMGMSLKDRNPDGLRSGQQTPNGSSNGSSQHLSVNMPTRMISESNIQMPLSPPQSLKTSSITLQLPPQNKFTKGSSAFLERENEIEAEFNDSFVTQIYNYLSIGYPVLAHPFDEELSRISKVPIEELRADDNRVDAKGYVGVPESSGLKTEEEIVAGGCARWSALKIYIKEWARQQPRLDMPSQAENTWGAPGRRGSWAI